MPQGLESLLQMYQFECGSKPRLPRAYDEFVLIGPNLLAFLKDNQDERLVTTH